jgi:transcriptional repressor NrdR
MFREGKTMKCPFCGYSESKVIDSRPADEGSSIRRRRECLACQKRFTTYETVESLPMVVIKKDGSRQSFDRRKILGGMIRACEKRPVPVMELEKISEEIEQDLQNSMEREISTELIGTKVMDRLKGVDEVAYVRFASVYRQFKDIDTFMAELNKLLADK